MHACMHAHTGAEAAGVLLPMMDLANHAFDASCEIQLLGDQRDKASAQVPVPVSRMPEGSACLVAKVDMAAEAELSLSYGELSNAHLLVCRTLNPKPETLNLRP